MKNRLLIGESAYLTEETSKNLLESARLELNKEFTFDELQTNLSAYKELSVEESNSNPQSISNGITKIGYYQTKDFYLIGKHLSVADEWERLFPLNPDKDGNIFEIFLPAQEKVSHINIDEIIATKVMGWHVHAPVGYGYQEWADKEGGYHGFVEDFNPTDDIRCAWKVAKKLGLALIPQSNGERKGEFNWYACDIESVQYRGGEIAIIPIEDSGWSKPSAPLAICFAALEVVGVDVEALQSES